MSHMDAQSASLTSAQLKKAKRDIRRRVLEARDAMAQPDRAHRSRSITERFLARPEVEQADVVMAFWSFGSEVDTSPLIEALHGRGVAVALPRIIERVIHPRTYAPGDPTTQTPFGALEPAGGQVLDPAVIDVIATPAVVFDRLGNRVGYGGGFYDRFFLQTRPEAFRAGLAFDVQLLPRGQYLPGAAFDQRVDAVVTEVETVLCARAR